MKSIHSPRLRRSALAMALGVCFAGGALAQSNSTGSISGTVEPGATVVIENAATGFHREITADASGSYRASALPTGTYTVTAGGQSRQVNVSIGTTTAATLGTVEVVGGGVINPIDVSSVESTTILTAQQIAKVPVARNITSVALLAPGTVKGDAAFGNLASFGGSSVAENQYYVNGFNITNAFNNLNFGQVPFEAIAEQQVKTGGYGAEFGRSTGGVINLVTKRGTNEFHAGGNLFYSPEFLHERNPNVYYRNGDLLENNSQDSDGTETTGSLWASGALVKDRLFAYALVQYTRKSGQETYGNKDAGASASAATRSPTWLLKLDWNISDDHLLELTAFNDTARTETDVYATPTTSVNDALTRLRKKGTVYNKAGGTSYSLKYTGYLSDDFTLSALYGHGESSRSNYGIGPAGLERYDGNVGGAVSGCPIVTDARDQVVNPDNPNYPTPAISGCDFIGVIGSPRAKDQRDQFRLDAEWQLGEHLLRFGFDGDRFQSYGAQSYEGGVFWRYVTRQGRDQVRKRVFQSGAGVEVDSQALYVEDRWQVTPDFLAYAGLRWDSFANKNGIGEKFVEIRNQFGPRLGFSWDVNGDQKFKVFGNAGRYALPLTATVAVRGASASLFTQQYFDFTGVDPLTGAPTGLTPASSLRYLNNEFGLAKNKDSIASTNLKPMYQDEYILGFQAQLGEHLSAGVRGIYRDLKRAIDDQCDYRPIYQWAADNGYNLDSQNTGFAFCHLYNPGSDGEFNVDVDGDGTLEHIHVDASVLGPKAKRTYKAAEVFFEGHWDRFFLQGSYTWSKSFGNTEGGVKSDIGQADTGTTQDFDYPELMIGATGYLPNDRRHSLKLFGNYEINDEWSLGANLLVQSGRPINCFGYLDGADVSVYGNSYFSCDPGPVELPFLADGVTPNPAYHGGGNNGTTIVPRGSAGRTPWTRSLDLNVAYRPAWSDGRLTLKMDVFNVFNERTATAVNEFGEDTVGNPLFSSTYKTPTAFQAPRSFRFLVQYDY